jgi:hypothetical protein
MRQLSYVLQFRGSVAPVAGSSQTLQAQTTAVNQTFRTMLGADGIQATVESPGGGDAAFTSRVMVNADGTFDETGTITYMAARERSSLKPWGWATCSLVASKGCSAVVCSGK